MINIFGKFTGKYPAHVRTVGSRPSLLLKGLQRRLGQVLMASGFSLSPQIIQLYINSFHGFTVDMYVQCIVLTLFLQV